jgi:hypothetical protein
MHSDFRIEKERLPVVIVTGGGERLFGDMFVQAYARHRSGREEPMDVLNGAERFFPLATADGQTLLIAKQGVRELEIVGEGFEPADVAGARPTTVEVTLRGGPTRVGRVYLEVPFDRPRLLDFLNRYAHPFLTLHTDDGVRLMNVALLERVRQLD